MSRSRKRGRARGGLRRRFFARFYSRIMTRYESHMRPRKAALFSDLPQSILEIGPGPGTNLVFVPPACSWIGVEPNPFMQRQLRAAAARCQADAEIRVTPAEQLEIENESIEAVVCTLVMCSVLDTATVLDEIKRVLVPGGRLYFIEHVAAPSGTWLRRCQSLVRPAWKWFVDGCCPDRDTRAAIERADFSSLDYEEFRVPFPAAIPIVSPHIAGVAIK